MADPMQQARELLAAESEEDAKWGVLNFPIEELRYDLQAALRAIAAALRAAPEVEALSESDKEIALGQAVELAQYVEKNAKGDMRDAAARFLSLSYAQEVAQRLRSAPDGFVLTPEGLYRPMLAARPQGVNDV